MRESINAKYVRGICLTSMVLQIGSGHAQVAIKVIQYRPLGALGFAFEKTVTGELMYMSEFDDRTRIRLGVTYARFGPRLDTFPTYAVMSGGLGTAVLPGYTIFHRYDLYHVDFGIDFKILEKKNFIFYPGLGILAGGSLEDVEEVYYTLSDSRFTGGNACVGAIIRAGAQYTVKDRITLFTEISNTLRLMTQTGFLSTNDIGLGIYYNFFAAK